MLEPEVIYEDRDVLVINKPAGLQVHAARIAKKKNVHAPSAGDTLVDWLVAHYPEVKTVGDDPELRPGIVHRLDKETSGVMMVAKNQKYFMYLKSLFQAHEVKKTYLAVVAGSPREKHGIIDAPIGIQNGTTKRSVRSSKMAKEAITEYRVLKTFSRGEVPVLERAGANAREEVYARAEARSGTHGAVNAHKHGEEAPVDSPWKAYALLEVSPKTGRTHQIRVHLASIGHPVVGDRLYGPKAQPAWAHRLMLHALSLEFTAADGRRVRFET